MSARTMKLLLSTLGTVAVALSAACGGDEPPPATAPVPSATVLTPSPPPGDPSPVTEGQVTIGSVHGVIVLVQRVPGAEFVEGNLYIRGGVRNLTEQTQGIEALGLEVAVSGGTQALAKEPFTRKLGSLAGTLSAEARQDFSEIDAKAPTASWDGVFDLMTAAFLTPALPASEVDLVRSRTLTDLKHEQESGDGRLTLAARKAVFAGHPYALRPFGTPEAVSAITTDSLTPYLAKLRQTNRLVLVVVGDVDAAHVRAQVSQAFANLPAGDYVDTPMPALVAKGTFVGDAQDLPTSYIQTAFASPSWGDPDFAPMWLGMNVLSFRLFQEVRTKRNLSYAPYAGMQRGMARPIGLMYVTATDPEATMKVMMDEARKLQSTPIPDKEFTAQKAQFLSNFTSQEETTEGRASLLGNAFLLGGDWHLADKLLANVKATTPADVQRVAKASMTGFDTAIVGHPEKLSPATVSASPTPTAR